MLYNYLLIIGRTVFWELQNACPALWLFLDYLCDLIYVVDSTVHAHEGSFIFCENEDMRAHCTDIYT